MKIFPLFFCSLVAFFFSLFSPLLAEPASEVLENISTEQYCAFLNAVETTGSHGFYHPEMESDSATRHISRSLTEDGIHFTYSIIDDSGELPITDINKSDAICFSNWLYHDCPTGDAVTDEVLYMPLDPNSYDDEAEFHVAAPTSISAYAPNKFPSAEQGDKPRKSSYLYDGLKTAASVAEWTFWNVGGEVVEAIVFQQLGLYALAPYCLYMGAVILHEYEHQEYWAAAGTILHATFDIACMLGTRIGFDVAGFLGSCLEKCGLKCVADFFGTIH